MTTKRWENVSTDARAEAWDDRPVTLGPKPRRFTIEQDSLDPARIAEIASQMEVEILTPAGPVYIARHVTPLPVEIQQDALDDLRTQLAEARSERDRAQARNRELEQRLATIRGVAK